MLVDASVTIAYKCPSCGSFVFFNISLFTPFSNNGEHFFRCRCGNTGLTIGREGVKGILVKTPCIGCGNEHIYTLRRKDIIKKDINIFYCPTARMEQCFIGRDDSVRKKVDSLERELDELIDMFGYDNYFWNTQVMFDSLNKIHDIAEQGNLYCECGDGDIELMLFPDRIYLVCRKCSASKVIYAASNEDLKDILVKQQILLVSDLIECDSGNTAIITKKKRW